MHIGGTNKSGVAANYPWWRLISYDAWGKQLFDQNNTSQTDPLISIGYTGHEHIPAFDLIDMKGRFYDPQLAQMLSPDPIITDFENAQTYNKYSYVFNNPLRYTDPTGYSGQPGGGSSIDVGEYLVETQRLETEEFLNELRTQGIVIGRELVVNGNEHEQEEQGGEGTSSGDVMAGTLLLGASTAEMPPAAAALLIAGSITAGAMYLHEKMTGFGNPKNWSYTYQHPSQNPIHNPPQGLDPENPPPGWSGAVKWAIRAGFAYKIYDEYNSHMNNLTPLVAPIDKTYVTPQFVPYRPK